MSITIELFGGAANGRLITIPNEYLYRPLHIPVAPSIIEILHPYCRCHSMISPKPLRYEWDGTVREDGVRRFRLR